MPDGRLTTPPIAKEHWGEVQQAWAKLALSTGSVLEDGHGYHQLPYGRLSQLPHTRPGTLQRLEAILQCVNPADKTVIDLGCSVGGMALGMGLAGAKQVAGVDRDSNSIRAARAAAKYLKLTDRVNFWEAGIGPILMSYLPATDIGIWLSQWMWLVEPLGIETALDLLFEASKKIQVLFFESAHNGTTKAWLPEYIRSQRDVLRLFEAATCYSSIQKIGQDPGWRGREILMGQDPQWHWQGRCQVMRSSRQYVRKVFKAEADTTLEISALRRLEFSKHVPKLNGHSRTWVELSYCGRPAKDSDLDPQQLKQIAKDLRHAQLEPNSVQRDQILALGGRLFLISPGRCAQLGGPWSKTSTGCLDTSLSPS